METQRPLNCLTPANQKAAVGGDFLSKKPMLDASLEGGVKSTPADPIAEEPPADLTADDISSPSEEDLPYIIGEGERVSELVNFLSDSSDTEPPDPTYDYLYNTPELIADRKNFLEYKAEYRRTKGFDMTITCNSGGLEPLPLDDKDDTYGLVKACWTGVEDAIDFKNKQQNRKLKLLEIVKCNFSLPWFFYATFRVVDENTGDEFTYQSKFIHDYLDGTTEIHRFRLKPESDG